MLYSGVLPLPPSGIVRTERSRNDASTFPAHFKHFKHTEEKVLCPKPWVSHSSIPRTRKRVAFLFKCGLEQSCGYGSEPHSNMVAGQCDLLGCWRKICIVVMQGFSITPRLEYIRTSQIAGFTRFGHLNLLPLSTNYRSW